ncbi:MAG: helix-turn-helix domain-containing protein [Desulfuromonadaceae bacterium]
MKKNELKIDVLKIEAERERRKESQEKFARRLGMKQTTYSAVIKKASTTLKRINQMANRLQVDPRDLLTL